MNENNEQNTPQEQEEKTFTQEEVNRIVGDRLARERAKHDNANDFEKREKDLAQRELRMSAKELLVSKGLSVDLVDALNCTDKEAMEASVAAIERAFESYKEKAPHGVYEGFRPLPKNGSRKENEPDEQIRRAMGLSTWKG